LFFSSQGVRARKIRQAATAVIGLAAMIPATAVITDIMTAAVDMAAAAIKTQETT
jgi:hypothetical protein